MQQKQLVRVIVTVAAVVAFLIYKLNRVENRAIERQKRERAEQGDRSQSPRRNDDLHADRSQSPAGNDKGSSRQEPPSPDNHDKPESKRKETNRRRDGRSGTGSDASGNDGEKSLNFNRRLNLIVYSRHARCRMDCRNIDESEIIEMRDKGKINYAKSELDAKRDPRFALEGVTHDKQRVRVVFAQTDSSLVVVTCIDLDTDWPCSCN